MPRRKLPEPRYITPASVDVGDTIRATWRVGDIEHSRVATVARIQNRTFFASDGQEIARWAPQGSNVRITLLAKAEADTRVPLFEFADLGEVRQRIS